MATLTQHLQKKRGAFLTCFIASFLLVLLSATGAVYINAIQVESFENALLQNVDYQGLGTDEASIRSFASETIAYLTDATASWNPQITVMGFPASNFIPQNFRDHMATVKSWVSMASAVFLAGAALVLLLLGRATLVRRRTGSNHGFSLVGYYLGAGLMILLLAGIGLWATFDFDSLWALLHKLLIPDGIFGAGELIMQLFPETLFSAYLPEIAKTFVLMLAGVLALPAVFAPMSIWISKRQIKTS